MPMLMTRSKIKALGLQTEELAKRGLRVPSLGFVSNKYLGKLMGENGKIQREKDAAEHIFALAAGHFEMINKILEDGDNAKADFERLVGRWHHQRNPLVDEVQILKHSAKEIEEWQQTCAERYSDAVIAYNVAMNLVAWLQSVKSRGGEMEKGVSALEASASSLANGRSILDTTQKLIEDNFGDLRGMRSLMENRLKELWETCTGDMPPKNLPGKGFISAN